MSSPSSSFLVKARQHAAVGMSLFALIANLGAFTPIAAAQTPATAVTPIQHVIVIIGENRTFDHVYATFKPKKGQTVANLLSRGIVNADGTPGINYELSAQYSAVDSGAFEISPGSKAAYYNIPAPETASAPTAASDTSPAPFVTLSLAKLAEPGLLPSYNKYLLTGATGLAHNIPDTRIPNVNSLGSGVFQLTSATLPYDAYAASPVHRFYQMWQQTDCSVDTATSSNPSGCLNDLFSWVETTIGAGSNGNPQPATLNTGEGSTALAFFNVQKGDAPYFKQLAQQYTISDNFHQSVEGGTGANHIMFGYADAIAYSDGKGNLATPPTNQIENPDPQASTNNYYDQDGYSGGSYSNCNDLSQPGVPAVVNYLQSLTPPIAPNCASGAYYLLNNYNPGYVGDGTLDSQYTPFTIPPTAQKHIGDSLSAAGLSYTYFGEGWDLYTADPTGANPYDRYCAICNPFQYASDVMSVPAQREAHIQDTRSLYEDLVDGNLPAVSIVKPSGFTDGHPSSSKLDLFEGFVKNIVTKLQANPTLWASTAVFITFDEGGGYYDSGYIQPLDFFGDGTRIPLVIVSPYSTGGVVNHSYGDHVSIIKFIDRNWGLPPITSRSRDNYPNPTTKPGNPYVPTNSPAIDDLFDAFNFGN
ncbi:MAG: alkaline phosphatase family protein [Candidatus Sulfotelmatobacter sp.]